MHQKSHGNYTARFMFRLSIIFFQILKMNLKFLKRLLECACVCVREREKN